MHFSGLFLVCAPSLADIRVGKVNANSLKNHNVDIQPIWEMGEATMALPLEEKMTFEQGNTGRSFG